MRNINITTRGRYALRVMVDLAQNAQEKPVSLKTVADRQGISMKYLEGIVCEMKKNGLLESARGKEGGYRLTASPDKISAGQILRCVEESLAPVACIKAGSVSCGRAAVCLTLPMWKELDDVTNNYLDSVTLADLMTGEKWK